MLGGCGWRHRLAPGLRSWAYRHLVRIRIEPLVTRELKGAPLQPNETTPAWTSIDRTSSRSRIASLAPGPNNMRASPRGRVRDFRSGFPAGGGELGLINGEYVQRKSRSTQ